MEDQYITNEKGQCIFTTKNTKPSPYFINYLHYLSIPQSQKVNIQVIIKNLNTVYDWVYL